MVQRILVLSTSYCLPFSVFVLFSAYTSERKSTSKPIIDVNTMVIIS